MYQAMIVVKCMCVGDKTVFFLVQLFLLNHDVPYYGEQSDYITAQFPKMAL